MCKVSNIFWTILVGVLFFVFLLFIGLNNGVKRFELHHGALISSSELGIQGHLGSMQGGYVDNKKRYEEYKKLLKDSPFFKLNDISVYGNYLVQDGKVYYVDPVEHAYLVSERDKKPISCKDLMIKLTDNGWDYMSVVAFYQGYDLTNGCHEHPEIQDTQGLYVIEVLLHDLQVSETCGVIKGDEGFLDTRRPAVLYTDNSITRKNMQCPRFPFSGYPFIPFKDSIIDLETCFPETKN